MSLPSSVQKNLLSQFDALIAEGNEIRKSFVFVPAQSWVNPNAYLITQRSGQHPEHNEFDASRMSEWMTRCATLLDHAVPKQSIHVKWIEEMSKWLPSEHVPDHVIPKLNAFRKDLESGLFDTLISRIDAEIAADYMSQADELLAEGQRGNHDHVPAAVLAGATLEKRLRKLCEAQTPKIDLLMANGKKKMLNTLIDDLKTAGLYNETRAKQLRHWAGIRNHAAHGEFDQFHRIDVENMLPGIKSFLEEFN